MIAFNLESTVGTTLVTSRVSDKLTSTTFEVEGRRYEIVTRWVQGAQTEVYKEYAKHPGLMRFVGFLETLHKGTRGARVIRRAVEPFLQAHQDAHASWGEQPLSWEAAAAQAGWQVIA